jgi:hypothetical protein
VGAVSSFVLGSRIAARVALSLQLNPHLSNFHRWQVNGKIEEVKVYWYDDIVAVSNKYDRSRDGDAGPRVRLELPKALFQPSAGGARFRGSVFPAKSAGSAPIGHVELAPRRSDASPPGEVLQWRCPVGHGLLAAKSTPHDPRICDVCDSVIPDAHPLHACESTTCPVGYDVCDRCFVTARLCPNGHVAVPYTVGRKVPAICDACTRAWRSGSWLHRVRL